MMRWLVALLVSMGSLAQAKMDQQELRFEIDRLVEMHLVGESLLRDFDNELKVGKKNWSLENSKSYQKLLALRIQREKVTHQVAHEVMELIANGEPVLQVVQSLNDFATQSPEHILILEEIANQLVDEQPELGHLLLDNETRNQIVQTQRIDWIRRGRSIRNNKDFGSVKIEKDHDFAGRAKIEPGTGANGNITGSGFPARTWALTFDDGPHGTHTLLDLAQLQAHGVRATFFWLAENVLRLTNIVATVRSAGMSTQNHSYSHPDLRKLSAAGLKHEIADSTDVETRLYGERPRFFRLPYGAGVSNLGIRQRIADQKLIHVFWNVDSLDWQDKNSTSIFNRVKTEMTQQGRGVILHHDIQPPTPGAVKLLLDWSDSLKGTPKQLRWVTLPEIVDELNQ